MINAGTFIPEIYFASIISPEYYPDLCMKRMTAFLALLAVCILVLSAGCMGIPGSSKSGSPAPAPVVTEPTGMAGSNWTGTFMTTWSGGGHDNRMVLVQAKNVVVGTYEYNDGTITGTVQGNRLTGTWSENNGASKGPVEFEMTPDGKSFAGWWGYEGGDFSDTKKGDPTWTGIRVS